MDTARRARRCAGSRSTARARRCGTSSRPTRTSTSGHDEARAAVRAPSVTALQRRSAPQLCPARAAADGRSRRRRSSPTGARRAPVDPGCGLALAGDASAIAFPGARDRRRDARPAAAPSARCCATSPAAAASGGRRRDDGDVTALAVGAARQLPRRLRGLRSGYVSVCAATARASPSTTSSCSASPEALGGATLDFLALVRRAGGRCSRALVLQAQGNRRQLCASRSHALTARLCGDGVAAARVAGDLDGRLTNVPRDGSSPDAGAVSGRRRRGRAWRRRSAHGPRHERESAAIATSRTATGGTQPPHDNISGSASGAGREGLAATPRLASSRHSTPSRSDVDGDSEASAGRTGGASALGRSGSRWPRHVASAAATRRGRGHRRPRPRRPPRSGDRRRRVQVRSPQRVDDCSRRAPTPGGGPTTAQDTPATTVELANAPADGRRAALRRHCPWRGRHGAAGGTAVIRRPDRSPATATVSTERRQETVT